MAKAKKQSSGTAAIPENMRGKHDAIAALIDDFCRRHLNEEYHGLCRRMLSTLARKRPSPLVNGTAAAWACGIVRTIGWVNFLDDKEQQPHMKMAEVDKAFGVSSGTGQAKSKFIRDTLKIRSFDVDWSLQSRIGQNPMAWLIEVNGMIMDARYLPREVQEIALEKGLIPYLPTASDTMSDE